MIKKKHKHIIFLSVAVFTMQVGCFSIYVNDDFEATSNALTYMESADPVNVVKTNKYVAFEPIFDESTDIGIIFFQGGKVDHRAYAPLLHDIASNNILAVAVISPLKLAMFALGIPKTIMKAYPDIDHWIVMGHSLGGVFGSLYTYHNDEIDGLILLASYVTKVFRASQQHFLSITASEDHILNKNRSIYNYVFLPYGTTFTLITGGNHAQFGDYGPQPGDGGATITPEFQRSLVVAEIVNWITEEFITEE